MSEEGAASDGTGKLPGEKAVPAVELAKQGLYWELVTYKNDGRRGMYLERIICAVARVLLQATLGAQS